MKQKRVISKWAYYFSLGVALIIAYKCISDFNGLCSVIRKITEVIMP